MNLTERHWDQLVKHIILPDNPDECFDVDLKGNYGYGQIRLTTEKRVYRLAMAHRVSWHFNNGPIPAGLCVLHSCDNRKCVRPDHLFLGTRADNTKDMVIKGRANGGTGKVLSIKDVMEVRQKLSGGERQIDIAKEYGVNRGYIWKIKHNKAWRHIQ